MTRFLSSAGALLAFCSLTHAQEWIPLFDGKSRGEWKDTGFRTPGEVKVQGGELILGAGQPLTGVTWTGKFPKSNYEIRFEAAKRSGGDFFASLTFPYKDSFATFVAGGWGGDIVGISSIDEWDASENETRSYFNFEPNRWYRFRVAVTDQQIQAWIDDQAVVNLIVAGRTINLRPGPIELSAPLGFAAYNSEGAIRKIEYRLLQR